MLMNFNDLNLINIFLKTDNNRGREKYSSISYQDSFAAVINEGVNYKSLPYRPNSFHMIIHCLPVQQLDSDNSNCKLYSPPAFPIQDLVHVLLDKGFLLLGCTESRWEQLQYSKLADYSNAHKQDHNGTLMVLQKIDLPIADLRSSTSDNITTDESIGYDENVNHSITPTVKYCLAVIRKM